jgi:hypothetical protein
MAEITLVNSDKKATVDDEDFEYINQFTWYLDPEGYCVTFDLGFRVEMGYLVLRHHGAIYNAW